MIYDMMPVSVADYPGIVAATVFVSGCNFKCPYCHNSSIINTAVEGLIDEKDITGYLVKRKGLIDGVCVTGGEPTLWPGLAEFIEKVKGMGLKIKLDTNGARPVVIKKLLAQNSVDYIAMDIKSPLKKYGLFVNDENDIPRIKESADIIMGSGIKYEFRTTVHQKILDMDDFEEIGRWLSGAPRYVIQGYKYSDDVLDKEFCGSTPCDIHYLEDIKNLISSYFGEVLIRA